MKRLLSVLLICLLCMPVFSAALGDASVGSIEQPLSHTDFFIRYPGYEPFAGNNYSTIGYSEDWRTGDLIFSVESEYMPPDATVLLYSEASYDSPILGQVNPGDALWANGIYDGSLYDGYPEYWYLCCTYMDNDMRYGWVPVSHLNGGFTDDTPSDPGYDQWQPSDPSGDAVVYGYTIKRLSTRSGPGSQYPAVGTYNSTLNQWIGVRARAWDDVNEMWWVEVLIGDSWSWTPFERFDPGSIYIDDIPLSYAYSTEGATSDNSGEIYYGYTIKRISTRLGPGTQYDFGGTYNKLLNQWVAARSRAWDDVNEMWWVEVLIGDRWEWTPYERFDSTTLPLETLPICYY